MIEYVSHSLYYRDIISVVNVQFPNHNSHYSQINSGIPYAFLITCAIIDSQIESSRLKSSIF